MHVQKVCRVIVIVLRDKKDWVNYVRDTLDPIIELEKGKLCQQEEKEKDSNSSNFDNNIFDDDFINGGLENNATDEVEDEDDHHKFFKKMQECFSSQTPRKDENGRRKSADLIEVGERERKIKEFAENNDNVKNELRNSLCDGMGEGEGPIRRRDRSTSNENFGLPPLSSFDDNKDMMDDGLNQNYKSNDDYKSNDENGSFGSNLAAASNLDLQIGHLEEIAPLAPVDLDIDDVDIDLDDEKKENQPEPLPAFDFFGKDLMPDAAPQSESLVDFSKIKAESKSENKEFEEMKNIFD